MACFRRNTTENFIFLLKYRQRKVDLNTSKKPLVFVTIRQKISSLRAAITYENFIFTQKYTFAKRSYIFVWRKVKKIWYFRETETYESKQKYDLFCTFHKVSYDENCFFMQCRILLILIFPTTNLLHVYYVNTASYETLEKIMISL